MAMLLLGPWVPAAAMIGARSAVRLQRTEDIEQIRAVIYDPSIYSASTDDAEHDDIFVHPLMYYLLVKVDEPISESGTTELTAGLVAFFPENAVTFVPHIGILSPYRGIGTEALKIGIKWMFENTACRKLVGRPPNFNHAMVRVFQKCGFHLEGLSPKSFLRHGTLHDRICFGLEKEATWP